MFQITIFGRRYTRNAAKHMAGAAADIAEQLASNQMEARLHPARRGRQGNAAGFHPALIPCNGRDLLAYQYVVPSSACTVSCSAGKQGLLARHQLHLIKTSEAPP